MPVDHPPLLKADKATVTFEALKDGKLRILYGNWADAVVTFPGERIEVVWATGQVNLRKKDKPR